MDLFIEGIYSYPVARQIAEIMKWKSVHSSRLLFCIFSLFVQFLTAIHVDETKSPWLLPVVPTNLEPLRDPPYDGQNRMIPRSVWITSVDAPPREDWAPHLKKMLLPMEAAGWNVTFFGDKEIDVFMHSYFANTSLLWAYKMIDPSASVGWADLWRIAILYAEGGLYMDDDSYFECDLDAIITPNDALILSTESAEIGICYDDQFYLYQASIYNASLHPTGLFNGKTVINWAIFSTKRHPYMYSILEAIVNVVRSVYLGLAVFPSNHPTDFLRVRHSNWLVWYEVICGTGPKLVTSALRHTILAKKYSSWAPYMRVAREGFGGEFRATFKAPGHTSYHKKKTEVHVHYKKGMKRFVRYHAYE